MKKIRAIFLILVVLFLVNSFLGEEEVEEKEVEANVTIGFSDTSVAEGEGYEAQISIGGTG